MRAFSLSHASRLPITGGSHPLRRESIKWLSWANAFSLVAVVAVFATWSIWTHRHKETAGGPEHGQKVLKYIELGVPPSIAKTAAGSSQIGVVAMPTFGVPEPVPDEQAPKTNFAPDLVVPSMPTLGAGEAVDPDIAVDLTGVASQDMETNTGSMVFESYELDQPPQAVVKEPPSYPYKARELGVEGSVQVKMLVQKDGSVGDVKILDARPKGVFDEAVYQALAQWRFNPGKVGGKAVMAWVVTTVHFDLN
ncbi:MAG TPA: energy transducer TonB [Candidatus Bathyarchaeia archaeon]|nr:energy transducer TonB [Candidatus Bathyarchaeia archaeon]